MTYGYDSFGNLKSQKRSVSGGSAPTERYRYDQLQRLIGADRPGAIVTYGCDAAGNQISGSAITATYDAENRPRIVQKTLSSPGTPACRRDLELR